MGEKQPMGAVFRQVGEISGLGFSVAAAILLFVGGARLLQNAFHLGNWIMLMGILAGLIAAGLVVAGFFYRTLKRAEEQDKTKEKPDHDAV